MSAPQTDGCPTCQVCGSLIHRRPYYWNDDPRLPMHPDMRQCRGPNPNEAFAGFMNRNVDYINGRGEPVLLPVGETN